MQETQEIQPLVWEDPLEEEMVLHSSIPTWKIPWTEEPISRFALDKIPVPGHLFEDNPFEDRKSVV